MGVFFLSAWWKNACHFHPTSPDGETPFHPVQYFYMIDQDTLHEATPPNSSCPKTSLAFDSPNPKIGNNKYLQRGGSSSWGDFSNAPSRILNPPKFWSEVVNDVHYLTNQGIRL
jgi:hypothetical protein